MRALTLWLSLFLCVVGNPTKLFGATISPVNRTLCNLYLHGKIEPGDLDRVTQAVAAQQKRLADAPSPLDKLKPGEIPRFMGDKENVSLCLNSEGGDYTEALLIIRFLLNAGGIATVVDAGSECYSACALIFMFGYVEAYHSDKFFDRKLHIAGKLGFHSPYIAPETANYNKDQVLRTFLAGVQAVANLMEIDRNEFLARGLVIEFLKTPPNSLLEVDTVDKAGAWTIELVGHTQPKSVTYAAVERACDNEESWAERRKVREFEIGKYVEKKRQTNQLIKFSSGRATVVLQGYGDEGGGFCVVRLQDHGAGGIAIDLSIVPDQENIKRKRKEKDFTVPLGSGLVTPGFGETKPAWFLRNPATKIINLQSE